MMNYIWGGMIIISLIAAVFNGRIEEVALAASDGAKAAIDTGIALLGITCLWTGLAKVGERAGMIKGISRLLKPVLSRIFPKLDDESAKESIVMNIAANMFGMGNAATPLGIKAMNELSRAGKRSSTASNAMCMFVVLNTASIQLVPTTLISLRQAYGSANPGEITLPVWIASLCALAAGIAAAKLFERRKRL